MSQLPVDKLQTNAKALDLGSSSVYHLPDWHKLTHPQRLKVIRRIAASRGRDPRIAKLAINILRKSGARPRQYVRQAAAILKWVQDPKNVYYVNEPGERLQDPIYTIKAGFGDCDDQCLMLGALFESIGLPWKLVLSGRGPEGKTRYIEDGALPHGVSWTHIYCMVGDRPFQPSRWYFCEPTVEGVPLGWDVISGDHRFLPEMLSKSTGPATIAASPLANSRYRPPPAPALPNRSPAYAEALAGDAQTLGSVDLGNAEHDMLGELDAALSGAGSTVAGAVAESVSQEKEWSWGKIGVAVVTGVSVSVFTTLVLDFIKGDGMYKGSGSFLERWGKHGTQLSAQSFLTPPGV